MKVIMLENIEKVGKKGEVVNVKRGYARNYLIPRVYALYATPENLKKLGTIQLELKAAELKQYEELKKLAEKIASVKLTFDRKVDEHGSMFGSVSENDIAQALKQLDIDIHRSAIQLEHHIKELGEHSVDIRLHKEIVAKVAFVINSEAE